MRVTIGDVTSWSIEQAQKEARTLQVTIDQGNDPRQVEADKEASKEAERLSKEAHIAAEEAQERREALTLGLSMGRIFKSPQRFLGRAALRRSC